MTDAPSTRQAGQVLALFAFGFLAFVTGVAFVVDGGNAFAQHRTSQNATDAAAIAGATVLAERLGGDSKTDAEVKAAVDGVLSSMACKAAVKAGNRLAPEEILALLAGMRDTGSFSHCPHGRPVIKTFARREIEQWFRRA